MKYQNNLSNGLRAAKATRFLCGIAAGALALHASTASAQSVAQPAQTAEEAAEDTENATADIVVTGTQIRGVAPTGTNVVSVTSADVVASGAQSATQVLATIPQITSSFNNIQTVGTFLDNVIRPNIRNLGGRGGGTTTLVLFDGHRPVSAGVTNTAPDPDAIPPGMIERVEIVPDGGSSIYGSDAVGGVINFITKKRFNGIEAFAHAGFAKDYEAYDANVTVGKAWETGSVFASFSHARHSALFGRDRKNVFDQNNRIGDTSSGYCPQGTVVAGTGASQVTYALPDRVAGTIAQCGLVDDATFYPRERRHSVFAGVTQDLSSSLELDIRGYYTHRDLLLNYDLDAQGRNQRTITRANPYYVPIGPNDTGTQQVRFSFRGALSDRAPNELDIFQITLSLTAKVGGDWQVRALTSYGRSVNEIRNADFDEPSVADALASSNPRFALNPYNPSASQPSALFALERLEYGRGAQKLYNGRVIADGTLFNIAGGGIKAAFGAEWAKQTLDVRRGEGIVPGREDLARRSVSDRTIKSAFGELVIPLVGQDNRFGGVHALRLSASARYDDYSDFGTTFNPKLGLTFQPVEWITLRGNWGKSFNAPSLADLDETGTRFV